MFVARGCWLLGSEEHRTASTTFDWTGPIALFVSLRISLLDRFTASDANQNTKKASAIGAADHGTIEIITPSITTNCVVTWLTLSMVKLKSKSTVPKSLVNRDVIRPMGVSWNHENGALIILLTVFLWIICEARNPAAVYPREPHRMNTVNTTAAPM
jgi:hypothetical protein